MILGSGLLRKCGVNLWHYFAHSLAIDIIKYINLLSAVVGISVRSLYIQIF
jgi:hypothetical protein